MLTCTLPKNRCERLELLLQLPVQDVALMLASETKKFLTHQPYDDLAGMALFTLAVHGNQHAWSALYEQYKPLVLSWVSQHPSATLLFMQDGGYEALVNASFARFALAVTPMKMATFDSLAAVMTYVKMCVHSVVADEVRSRQSRPYDETLESIEHEPASEDLADEIVSSMTAHDLWHVLQEELNGEKERVLMYLVYVQGMKPGEISRTHLSMFPTVDGVYRLKRNVLTRLRRNRRLQRFESGC